MGFISVYIYNTVSESLFVLRILLTIEIHTIRHTFLMNDPILQTSSMNENFRTFLGTIEMYI